MQKFIELSAVAAPLPIINVDTDMIIPKQFLKTIKRTGLGKNLFDEMRFTKEGQEIPEFVLNQKQYRNAGILVSGQNFGCGSSREHAPWALMDFGIRCVIAACYADIFYNNCFKNGILPITLPQAQVDELMKHAQSTNSQMSVDLKEQMIRLSGSNQTFKFELDPARKKCLLEGLDDIGITLTKAKKITSFEQQDQQSRPWLYRKESN
jgi:3-isopropylmalate/(R)-2-methylmalate dehydratase small subunit